MVAQMAKRVAADSRVFGLNPAKDPMEGALINQSYRGQLAQRESIHFVIFLPQQERVRFTAPGFFEARNNS